MKRHIMFLLTLMLSVLMLSHGLAVSSDRSFSNTDLERYKGDVNGVIIPETAPPVPVKKEKTAKKKQDEKSKEYWCSSGSSQRAKVNRAKAMVETAERKLADIDNLSLKNKIRSDAERKVRSAKKKLYRAEQAFKDLEQTAHRQNIPSGWLRCQFSY
jgi:hypothetical protein